MIPERRVYRVMHPALALLALLVSGCVQGPFGMGSHRTVPAERRILLVRDGQEASGQWQGNDLRLNYRYRVLPASLQLSGTVELATYLTHFDRMRSLSIYAHLVDESGHALSGQSVFWSGHDQPLYLIGWRFERELPLTPQAIYLTFSYNGSAVSGGSGFRRDDTGGSWEFWQTPY